MKISVALCTYNGARYLEGQILSILQQTVLPSEIVCCDDGSTDRTLEILKKFSAANPGLFRIYCNKVNLGPRKNFEKGLSSCTGDLIFLCDQDDEWLPKKVERTLTIFEKAPEVQGCFSNGLLIDGDGIELQETMWDALYFEPMIRQTCRREDLLRYILLNGNIATGAAMAIRRDCLSSIIPFYIAKDTWHDHWIALILSATRQLEKIDEPLIRYRVHLDQQVGFPGRNKSNQEFRFAVHTTWMKSKSPELFNTQVAHLAWGLQAWEYFRPIIRERINQFSHFENTGSQMKEQFQQLKTIWMRQLPWKDRKIKLFKHWLKGGEYLRIGWKDILSI